MNSHRLHVSAWKLLLTVIALPLAVSAAPLVVKTVPWVATNPLIPHVTYSGKAITLKGTCNQRAADIRWTWDFGDGSGVVTGVNADMYALQAQHTYTAAPGTVFTARLTVDNMTTGESASKPYYVQVMDKALEVEANIAIDEGLWYLHKAQYRFVADGADVGDWTRDVGYGTYAALSYYGLTAANVNAFEVNGHLESGDPDNPYTETVQRGLRRLFQWLRVRTLTLQSNGLGANLNPDSNGNGFGLHVNQSYPYYQGGMFIDAIVASGTPNAGASTGPANVIGRTYKDIIQDMVDDHAAAEYDASPGGGWRYNFNEYPDNSACQWAAIGLIAAESQWGCIVPLWVKEWNVPWLAYTQHPSGYFGYTDRNPVWGPFAVTPSGMVQMVMDGIGRGDPGSPSWDLAETYMRNNFGNSGGPYNAIKDYYYGLFSFVKAMLLHPDAPITLLQSSTPGVPPIDWYAAEASNGAPTDGVARTLIGDQSPAGYWYGHNLDGSQYRFETAWAVMMLHRTVFESGVPVAVAKCLPNPGIVGETITVDGSDSYHQDPTRTIVGWEWDLDADGTFEATGPFATTSFSAVGNFPLKLRVTDDSEPARVAETIVTAIIATPPLAPTADANGPYSFCPLAQPWYLDGRRSVNPDEGNREPHDPPYPPDTIQEYAWDLDGDGGFDDASGPTPDVTDFFEAAGPGSYKVYLRVTDTTAASYPSSGYANLSSVATADVFVREGSSPECGFGPLVATGILKQIELDWPVHPEAEYYNVYRSTEAGGPYTWNQAVATNSAVDAPGVLNRLYYYVVRVARANGDEIVQSNEAAAEPLHPPPSVSATLATEVSNSRRDYYRLNATSACFGRMQLRIFVGDTASSQVAEPYFNDYIVRIRRGATPSVRPGIAGVAALIQVKGQARIWAQDPIDQTSTEILVP